MNKKAQEDSTLVWVVAIFIILFILVVYFFIAFLMTEKKSLDWKVGVKDIAYSSQDISFSETFASILNTEIEYNHKNEKVLSAILNSFESYFEAKNSEGASLVEKYSLDNKDDISRTTKARKIKDGFKEEELDKIEMQNQALTDSIKKVLDKYCNKYRLAIPQGMISEKEGLKSSDILGNRIYFVRDWGFWTPVIGFNISYNSFMTNIEFTQLEECSISKSLGGENE